MSDTDPNQDEVFPQMLERFFNRLMTVHGLSHEEAWITKGELKRAYDERKRRRRSNFTLIRGEKPD